MKLILLIVLLLLSACAAPVDKCTTDPNLPDCQSAQASANATIAAIDIQRAATNREATRQAMESAAGAIMRATQAANAISAQATKDALEIQAMTQTLMMSATLSAISANTARVKSQIELSTTQIIGSTEIAKRQVESDWTPALYLGGLVLLAFVAVSVAFAFRRSVNAVANAAEVRAALVTHGQHAWLVLPNKDGIKQATDLTNMLGDTISTDGLNTIMDQLDVSDRDKLQAWVDLRRLRAAVDISANIHAWPDVEQPIDPGAAQIAVSPTLNARYQIIASAEQPRLLTSAPQAVDVLDAEWRRLEERA